MRDQRKDIARCVLTHENIKVRVVRQIIKGVVIPAVRSEPIVGAKLARGQKAAVILAGEEREARVSLWGLRAEIGGQLARAVYGDEIASMHTGRHLTEETHRHLGELIT